MNSNGGDDAIGLCVDHRDSAGLVVDDVDFVADGICDKIGRIYANLERPVLTQIDKIKHRNGVGAPIADVGELAIAVGNVGKAAPVTARDAKQERADSGSNRSRERVSGEGHCSESIEVEGAAASERLGSTEFRVSPKLFVRLPCL